jgi:RNA polymerase sigma factor (sigma-70 family)
MSSQALAAEYDAFTPDRVANGLGGQDPAVEQVADDVRRIRWQAQVHAADTQRALLAAYLQRRDELVRFFTRRLKSAAAAEDLVQDIYLRIAHADPGADVRNAGGYLYRLGSNLMLDKIRGERRRAARDHNWRDSHRTLVGGQEVSEDPPADHVLAARQRLEAVVAVVRGLPEQTQRIFRMHKFDGQSHSEVAQALGISRSAVEKHCMAALKQFAARLEC